MFYLIGCGGETIGLHYRFLDPAWENPQIKRVRPEAEGREAPK
jgi:hypothetical protein